MVFIWSTGHIQIRIEQMYTFKNFLRLHIETSTGHIQTRIDQMYTF